MKKNILTVSLLILITALAFAAAPRRIDFAGEVYVLKGEPQVAKNYGGMFEQRNYQTMEENSISSLQVQAMRGNDVIADNDKRADKYLTDCSTHQGLSCFIDSCSQNDVVVGYTQTINNKTVALVLKRFTPKGFITYEKQLQPDEEFRAPLATYRSALCQLDVF